MRHIFLLLVLLAPSWGNAQQTRPIQCRFLSFGARDELTSVLAVSDKGNEINCPLSNSQISPQIACLAKDNTISFLSSSDKKPLASVHIAPGIRTALLIFVKKTEKPSSESAKTTPWHVLFIDDSPENFPDGGAFIANFYTNDIRFVIGEHKGMLHAAGSHGYAMPKELDSFNMAPVVFEFQQQDKWYIANESALRFLPGMRYLIFAYVDPTSGRPRINTYQDFTPLAIEKPIP